MLSYRFLDDAAPAFQVSEEGGRTQSSYLTLQVLNPDRTPAPKVVITIYAEQDTKPVTEKVLRTGLDGRTERIMLAVPAKSYSLLTSRIEVPFLTFSIRLEAEGYFTETYRMQRIYAESSVVQTLVLTPLPLGSTPVR